MFITTRSIFKVYNGRFNKNFADSDSTISALKTSTNETFIISGCTFTSNRAGGGNLMSAKMSNGDITDSVFLNNIASTSTNNLFLSFATVNISNSKF